MQYAAYVQAAPCQAFQQFAFTTTHVEHAATPRRLGQHPRVIVQVVIPALPMHSSAHLFEQQVVRLLHAHAAIGGLRRVVVFFHIKPEAADAA